VSPDGKLVAFSSGRGGRTAEYVVGADGRGLRRVSPFLGPADPNSGPQLTAAWSRTGKALAVLVSPYAPGVPRIYLASPRGGAWRPLTRPADKPLSLAGWSPRGTLAYVAPDTGSVRVVDTRGKVLLDTAGVNAWWSPSGRLAVARNSVQIAVYDPRLRRVSSLAGARAAWSADDVLATVTAKGLLQLRPRGVGRPSLSRRVARNEVEVQWVGPRRLRVLGDDGWLIVDGRTGHTFLAAGAFAVYNSVVAADGTVAVGERFANGSALLRTRLGGSTRTLAATAACGPNGSAWENLQLLPDGSAVYDTAYCLVSSDIWSVSGAGGAPAQLTRTPADETEPALSPDGTHIAYTSKATADGCKGCDETLWLMNADGTAGRSFPNGPDPDVNFDDSPTFSPDGKTIMFARSGPNAASLYTVPAAGGAAEPLGIRGLAPVWGPTRIAYANLVNGLSVADPDGTHATALHLDGSAAWSPAGRLAILRSSDAGALSIYFADTGTSIPLPGFHGTYHGVGLAWSPDGTRLAFDAADGEGVGDLWTIGADGKGLARVTRDLGVGGSLSWR
jgi:Tol biopolymer transport system component